MQVRLLIDSKASHCCCSYCATVTGAVVLNKVGTFDTYELQIMVSFRKGSKPVPLSGTSHRYVCMYISAVPSR